MTERAIRRLVASFRIIRPRSPELADRFFARLFVENPSYRPYYPVRLGSHKQQLTAALADLVARLQAADAAGVAAVSLAERCFASDELPEAYPVMRETLVGALGEIAGAHWNRQLERDWRRAVDKACPRMAAATSGSPQHGGPSARLHPCGADPQSAGSLAGWIKSLPKALFRSRRRNRFGMRR